MARILASLSLAHLFFAPGLLLAETPPDAPAPTLAVPTDPRPPRVRLSCTTDVLGAVFGRYGATLGMATGDRYGLAVSVAGTRGGLGLAVGAHVWPLGRGLAGLFFGPVAGVLFRGPAAEIGSVEIGLEVGYQHVWGGLVVGAAVGISHRWAFEAAEARSELGRRVQLLIGWAFR